MKSRNLFALSALILAAGTVVAQPAAPLDVEIVFAGAVIDGVNGGASAVQFDTIAVTPDGNLVYIFDSVGTADSLYRYDVGGATAALFANEADLAGGSASAGDLAADATNVYMSIFDGTVNRIWSAPHVAGFGSSVRMVGAGSDSGLDEIAVDTKNSRLVLSYNDAFGGTFSEDLVTVALTANLATPTVIATEADMEVALATIPGYTDDTSDNNDDLNIFDMDVQSDGDIILSHGFSSGQEAHGSLLRVTETGVVSVFRTAGDIVTSAGYVNATTNIGSLSVNVLADDRVLIVATFTDPATDVPFIAVISADGTTQITIATTTELEGDADVTTDYEPIFRFDSKSAGDVDTAGDFYFFRQGAGDSVAQSAVFALRNVSTATTVSDWSMF